MSTALITPENLIEAKADNLPFDEMEVRGFYDDNDPPEYSGYDQWLFENSCRRCDTMMEECCVPIGCRDFKREYRCPTCEPELF